MSKTNLFQASLTCPDEFTMTYELVPGQGFGGKEVERLLTFAEQARADGRIKALSITDNPGGNPALAPVAIGSELLQLGIEPLIHFSLKDKNRNQVASHIFLYQRLQMHSLLVLGGDFPKSGYYGQAKPVFDLDTIQTLQLMQDMKNGCYQGRSGKNATNPVFPALFKGCVVSPFKITEPEQVWQYAKLLHKVKAGADFIITQLGFDMGKFAELMTLVKQENIDLPVLANVFIPSLSVARAMADGRVPGVIVSDSLVHRMEQEAAAGERQSRLDRAAALIVNIKKLGYRGVHIGGNALNFADLRYVMDTVETLENGKTSPPAGCDVPIKNCWHFFTIKPDMSNLPEPTALRPGTKPGAVRIHILSHHLLFSDQTISGRLFGRFCLFCARGKIRSSILLVVERLIKRLLFDCRMCGDCTLERSAYLCPQSGCPKQLVNGPCGGSRKGNCEVYPERRCFWVRVYERLHQQTSFTQLTETAAVPPKDWARRNTSSWINYFSRKK